MEHATSPLLPRGGVFLPVEQLSQNLAIARGRLIASFCATSGIMGAHDGNENRPSTVLSRYSTCFFEPWNLARLIGHLFDRSREKPWCRKCVHDVYRFIFIPLSIPFFHIEFSTSKRNFECNRTCVYLEIIRKHYQYYFVHILV